MGKAYANRKPVEKNDLYHTPKSLIPLLLEKEKFKKIWEPAAGGMAIAQPLIDEGFNVITSDLTTGTNFLTFEPQEKRDIITNPPFFLFDDFVNRAKELKIRKFAFIGRLNYLGTVDRYNQGIFKGLKAIYPFNRYIDYQTPLRDDGLFHVGAMATAWFVWEYKYKGSTKMEQLDVQPWAKLGGYDPDYYAILEHLGIHLTWTLDMKIDPKEIMAKLMEELEFCYTLREEAMIKKGTINEVLKATKSASFDRAKFKKWERV